MPTSIAWDKLSQKIRDLLNKPRLKALAYEHKFCLRQRLLSPMAFIHLCFQMSSLMELVSLSDYLFFLDQHYGIKMSKQGIGQRFNASSVIWLRDLLAEVLMISLGMEQARGVFSAVRILDSTRFGAIAKFASVFKGCGGDGSASGVKLHYEYDLLSGKIDQMHLVSASQNDVQAAYPKNCQSGALLMRDLGYWKAGYWIAIAQQGAYFLSRVKSNAALWEKKGGQWQKVGLSQVVENFIQTKAPRQSYLFYLREGAKSVASRVLIERLPEQVVEQRIRQRRAKYGQTLSQKILLFAKVNLFITNASQEQIPDQEIRNFYALRWQVELVFKTFKSIFHLHRHKDMSLHRFETLIYAKLILFVLGQKITALIQQYAWQSQKQEISFWKSMKQYDLFLRQEIIIRLVKEQSMTALFDAAQDWIQKYAHLEKKKHKASAFELIYPQKNRKAS